MENLPKVGTAILESLVKVLYFIFVWPFLVWLKSVGRISNVKDQQLLNLDRINTRWPLLTFFKRFFTEFMFDATVVLWYPLGLIFAIVMLVQDGFLSFAIVLIGTYYGAVNISIARDIFQFLVLAPLSKLMSWLTRPAKYLELDNKISNKKED